MLTIVDLFKHSTIIFCCLDLLYFLELVEEVRRIEGEIKLCNKNLMQAIRNTFINAFYY